MKVIAVDNGHGKNTAGRRTPPMAGGKVVKEWEFNHPTAKKLERILQARGFKVVMVSDTTADTALSTRINRANNARADLFVSIHYNALAGVWGSHGGIETLYYPTSANGKRLAGMVQGKLINATGLRDRGIKPRGGLAVLKGTSMPAILVEAGFMDNRDEAKLMLDEGYQQKVTIAIADGICEYFGIKPSKPSEPKPAPKGMYRVRKDWGNPKSQIGAFKNLNNAKAMADKNKGYKVFDENGKAVYPVAKPAAPKPKAKKIWENYITGNWVGRLQAELNKQFRAGLAVDGYFGDKTINALVNISQGARGNLTRILQERLAAKGFSPGSVDGIFGPATDRAVRQFQRYNKLAVDGIVGKNTWKALFRK